MYVFSDCSRSGLHRQEVPQQRIRQRGGADVQHPRGQVPAVLAAQPPDLQLVGAAEEAGSVSQDLAQHVLHCMYSLFSPLLNGVKAVFKRF